MPRVSLSTGCLLAFLVFLTPLLGCAALRPGIAGTPCPVAWAPSHQIDPARVPKRTRVQLRIGEREVRIELITQAKPDELIAVGLAQYGVRLFTIRLRGTDVTIEDAAGAELEFIATWVFDAFHRAFLIDPVPDASGLAWGSERVRDFRTPTGTARVPGEIRETAEPKRATRLLRRVFELRGASGVNREDGEAAAATESVTIDYPASSGDAAAVRSPGLFEGVVHIENPWCGYRASLAPI